MSSFAEGFDAFISQNSAAVASDYGVSYIESIEAEISSLVNSINNSTRNFSLAPLDSVKGFIAEPWYAGTHNIDAAVKSLSARAYVVDDNGLVDIITSWGDNYQSKINKNPIVTANQLAVTNEGHFRIRHGDSSYTGDNPTSLYYDGQIGLVATDKIDAIRDVLQRRVLTNHEIRPEVAENYRKVLDTLTDRIRSNQGSESIPITETEARELAQLAKMNGFDPEEWGLRTAELVNLEYIMSQAFKAGLSAALLSVILKIAPEVCGIICKLIKNGDIDVAAFKRVGLAAVKGGTEGFIRGTIAAGITIACKSGVIGEAFKSLDPFLIAAITVTVLSTVKNACMLSFGKINKHEFARKSIESLVIMVSAYGFGTAGAIVVSAIFPPVAALFGYMIGSLVGSIVGSFVWNGIYSCVLSFCVDSGCTFFGLVEHDYIIPTDVLESIGVKVFEYRKVEPLRYKPRQFQIKQVQLKQFEPLRVSINFLRRGVIAVGVIGYQ